MRCPDCRKPIMWLPNPEGRRVAVGAKTTPNGSRFVDAQGVLRKVEEEKRVPLGAPRYELHFPCKGAA